SKVTTTTTESTTTTTSKVTTTTTESTTTTTSKVTTTTTESTTTTTSKVTTTTTESTTTTTSVVGYVYSVETKAPQFYFSDDEEEFDPADLIESVTRYAVYSDGSQSDEGEAVTDLGFVDLGDTAPEKLYDASKNCYTLSLNITDSFGTQKLEAQVPVYIGVKGDANMDGITDAKDAAEILVYAAAVGAGTKQPLYSATDDIMEEFVFTLADVNGTADRKSALDATDAAAILVYAAAVGSGTEVSWEEILGAA
ncbi:MAG: cellulose-binding protein CttA-related protein, partial [Oscillospiraceae bacterium]|nr:cellulose-binding protein CttA-related protein [Oscillospiraceae bacterium]